MECMRDGVLKEAQVDLVHQEEIISSSTVYKVYMRHYFVSVY